MPEPLAPPISTTKMRLARLRLGLSHRALANQCTALGHHISQQQVSRIESGTSGGSVHSLKALSVGLGVEITDLLETA